LSLEASADETRASNRIANHGIGDRFALGPFLRGQDLGVRVRRGELLPRVALARAAVVAHERLRARSRAKNEKVHEGAEQHRRRRLARMVDRMQILSP